MARPARPARTAVFTAVLLASLSAFSWLVHERLEATLRIQLGAVLHATLSAAVLDVQIWGQSGRRAATAAAQDAEVATLATDCATGRSDACSTIERALQPYLRASRATRARLFDEQGQLLAHALDDEAQQLRKQPPPALGADIVSKLRALPEARVTSLGAQLQSQVPAWLFGIALSSQQEPQAQPMRTVLVFDQPLRSISEQLSATRVGRSGEAYLFDPGGRMLTESRFLSAEQERGRVIELRVPSAQGERAELTQAARVSIESGGGQDLDGYLDYRGVRVVGSYRFVPELQLGVVAEIDESDAYRTLGTLKSLFNALAGLLLLALAIAGGLVAHGARLRARAEHAERRAERFGQYRIEEKIGQGGMGAVYLASHALLRRKAAIKLLRADRVSADTIARFEREVQVTSRLTHPNTVAIYDYGRTDDGTFYYVMEHLEGLDLQRLVARFGPLPQARVLAFMRQVCGSLAEAHAAGVVHRDIKPANLFVCTRGGVSDTIKVLDFGIVHVGTVDTRESPIVLGTPEYMAPELFESASRASAQSDLYAVGVVAYYLLTGTPPFSGGTTTEVGRAHLTEAPVALRDALDEQLVDATLEAAILACLKKQPSARPSSALSLIALLDRSAIAHAWTQADADAWWREHQDALQTQRQTLPPESHRRSVMVQTRETFDTKQADTHERATAEDASDEKGA